MKPPRFNDPFSGRLLPLPGPELGTVQIDLPKTLDTGTFARYIPLGDKREVIVRRGQGTGFHYGLPQGQRLVQIGGRDFEIVTFMNLLSPPGSCPANRCAATSRTATGRFATSCTYQTSKS